MKYLITLFLTFLGIQINYAQIELAEQFLLDNPDLKHAHIGIYIYDLENDVPLYSHNSSKLFTVASNNKLYTLYAAKYYLGDSTTGIQYQKRKDTLYIRGTGDPTLLHDDFDEQAVLEFLKDSKLPIALIETENKDGLYGPGWSWDDYNYSYQPEKASLPLYGNVLRFKVKNEKLEVLPSYFSGNLIDDLDAETASYQIRRDRIANEFHYTLTDKKSSREQVVPFTVSEELLANLLQDTLKVPVRLSQRKLAEEHWQQLRNVPLDSMLKNMMHRSDNFYAEQTQSMISFKLFNEINNRKVLRHLLENNFDFLKDKSSIVDGSGLSNYSRSTPEDLTRLLIALKNLVPEEELYDILPAGGEGTLERFYHNAKDKLHAKTGTLSHSVAISGYLNTRSDKKLIFSVIINNLPGPADIGRKATEEFLEEVFEIY